MVVSVVFIVLVLNFQFISSVKYEFVEYTREAQAFDGTQCLTGCSPIDNECVVDWKWNKKNCRSYGPAPIYFTAKLKDPERKYCLSKCGFFGDSKEWCITTKDLKWDYCSSNTRKLEITVPIKDIETKTIKCENCQSMCTLCTGCSSGSYYWCNVTRSWDYCAPPALSRIPVLPADYNIGSTKKGKCDNFLQYHSTGHVSDETGEQKSSIPDDFLSKIADGIETTTGVNDSVARIYKLFNSETSVEKYTMVNIEGTYFPAVIRAHVTKNTLPNKKAPADIPEMITRKVRQQMSEDVNGYVLENIIAPEIGGLSEEYNIVPMSSDTSCAWYELSNAIRRWTRDTGGSVDILAVVFYKNVNSPVPKGFGISLKFRNNDNSLFVACQEQIYWSDL